MKVLNSQILQYQSNIGRLFQLVVYAKKKKKQHMTSPKSINVFLTAKAL